MQTIIEQYREELYACILFQNIIEEDLPAALDFLKAQVASFTKGSCIHPNQIPKRKASNHHKKLAKKRLRKSPKRKIGETTQGLEEPRRIIYTYQRGSYMV